MGFGQALSGLNAAAQNLDVIGNNIANASTVGYKTGSMAFADLYATSRIGLGVQVGGVQQRFTTGNIDVTGNQYDMAIDGASGFFRLLNANGETVYSRNGQFIKSNDNFVVNAQGMKLTGYPITVNPVTGERTPNIGADPVPLQIPMGNIAPKATTGVGFTVNLDSRQDRPDVLKFDPGNPASFNRSSVATVYDSLGNAHELSQYYVKRDPIQITVDNTISATGLIDTTDDVDVSLWEVFYTLDGEPLEPTNKDASGDWFSGVDASNPNVLLFSKSGTLVYAGAIDQAAGAPPVTATSTDGVFQISPIAVSEDWQGVTTLSPAEPLAINLNYLGATSFGNQFSIAPLANGYAAGEFASIAVAADGTIQAAYTNGQTQVVGVLALAGFNNVNGLKAVGGNAWIESPESGQAILGQPGTNGLATVKGQAVESSNVDMSAELVNMIIAQRTYQANAQTIKTQDQIMQTLISMR